MAALTGVRRTSGAGLGCVTPGQGQLQAVVRIRAAQPSNSRATRTALRRARWCAPREVDSVLVAVPTSDGASRHSGRLVELGCGATREPIGRQRALRRRLLGGIRRAPRTGRRPCPIVWITGVTRRIAASDGKGHRHGLDSGQVGRAPRARGVPGGERLRDQPLPRPRSEDGLRPPATWHTRVNALLDRRRAPCGGDQPGAHA